jgi:hypothetical protein
MWKDAVHAAAAARRAYPGNILTVRYEALAADPEATVRRICLFAALSFRPEMLAVGWVNAATQSGADSDSTTGGVSTAAVEEWPKFLSPEEIYLCQRLARREMERLGYSLIAVPWAARIKAPALLGRSALRLYSRARRRRPAQIALRARETSRRMVRRALNNFRLYKERQ